MNFLKKLLFKGKVNPQPVEYTVYYRKLCHDCDAVKSYLEKQNVAFEYLDCEEKSINPPFPVLVTPAMFKNGELVAYGTDIINYIKNRA